MTAQKKQSNSGKVHGFAQFVDQGLLSADTAKQIMQQDPHLEAAITADMRACLPTDPAAVALDPIARQFIPSIDEIEIEHDSLVDPLGDQAHSPIAGIVHRHADRCLLMPIAVCAVYCRFCFRKEQIGPGKKMLSSEQLEQALTYIEEHSQLFEVILSGGDPLMLNPDKLAYIFTRLRAIDHVRVIRIHTRIPIVDTPRMHAAMVSVLAQVKPLYIVLHINHVNELHAAARDVISRLQQAGIHLLSQSVLLRGVNDDVDTLEELMRELVSLGVKPYYIHQLDPARGINHFKVSEEHGAALMRALRLRCSGLCQPLYVVDAPHGEGAKMPITLDAQSQRD